MPMGLGGFIHVCSKSLMVGVGILVSPLVGTVPSQSCDGEVMFNILRKLSWARGFGYKDSSPLHIRFAFKVGLGE